MVVMVSGSGLQNRDEEIFYHKPFAVLADFLCRNGIASLRYDDRGYAKSTGNGESATTEDFAADAASALLFLNKRYQQNKIGVLGHSEGGQIAFMLAGDSQYGVNPSFVVTIGAPAVRGDSLLAEQSYIYLKQSGMDSTVCHDYRRTVLKLYDYIRSDGVEMAKHKLNGMCAGWEFVPQYAPLKANLFAVCEQINPWILHAISYSPSKDIHQTLCPALALYSGLDTQVPPDINAPCIKALNKQVHVVTLDGHNHLMQRCVTGSVKEYGLIEETISEVALGEILKFINTVSR